MDYPVSFKARLMAYLYGDGPHRKKLLLSCSKSKLVYLFRIFYIGIYSFELACFNEENPDDSRETIRLFRDGFKRGCSDVGGFFPSNQTPSARVLNT